MGCSWSGWPVEDVALRETVMVEVPEGVTMGGGGVIDALPPPHPARANVMQRMAAERAPQRPGGFYRLAVGVRAGSYRELRTRRKARARKVGASRGTREI